MSHKTLECGQRVFIENMLCAVVQIEQTPETKNVVLGGVVMVEHGDIHVTLRVLSLWIHEDQLPEDYPYSEMFDKSVLVDGVRMFPKWTK